MMTKDKAYPFLQQMDLDSDVILRLSLHLDRLRLGSDVPFTTPLGSDGKADIILDELDQIMNSNRDLINDTLYSIEISNREKFGPRSIAKPWNERKENLEESFETDSLKYSKDLQLPPPINNLRPIALSTALKLLKNNTNSGLPYFTRKSKVKERILKDFDYLLERKDPCILFTRTQEGNKTRDVWGYPMVYTLFEMLYYQPLLSYQKNQYYRSALVGPDKVSRNLVELVLKAKSESRTLYSVDFSHFDRDVKTFLQRQSFAYIKNLFQKEYAIIIDSIFKKFNSIGILTPDGVWSGSHGVPSGSTFTNEVDSISQMLISYQLPFINLSDVQIQGDDGVYLIPKGKEDELTRQFESYGLTVNREKSDISDDYAIFLQCLYHIDYINKGIIGGIYPIYRALNRLCFQERWSDFEDYDIVGKDYYSIRTLCILENCKYHPLFRDLVKLVLKYDKYSLDFSSQGLSNYMRMLESSKGAEGILINQYGDNIKGIKSFESYKLVKELS